MVVVVTVMNDDNDIVCNITNVGAYIYVFETKTAMQLYPKIYPIVFAIAPASIKTVRSIGVEATRSATDKFVGDLFDDVAIVQASAVILERAFDPHTRLVVQPQVVVAPTNSQNANSSNQVEQTDTRPTLYAFRHGRGRRNNQFRVEPPPSALNVTLPAFAAERRRAYTTAPVCMSVCLSRRSAAATAAGGFAAKRPASRRYRSIAYKRTHDHYINPAPLRIL